MLLAPDNVTVVVVQTLKTNESEQYYLKPVRPGDSNHVGRKRFLSQYELLQILQKKLSQGSYVEKEKNKF